MGNAAITLALWAFFGIAGLFAIHAIVDAVIVLFSGYEAFFARVRAWRTSRKTLIISEIAVHGAETPIYKSYWPQQTTVKREFVSKASGLHANISTRSIGQREARADRRKAG